MVLKRLNYFANKKCIDKKIIGDLKGACFDWVKASTFGNERTAKWVINHFSSID